MGVYANITISLSITQTTNSELASHHYDTNSSKGRKKKPIILSYIILSSSFSTFFFLDLDMTTVAEKSFTGIARLQKPRRMVLCGGCFVVFIVVAVVILVILGLTVFKVRGPEMKVNSITIHPDTGNSNTTTNSSSSTNVTVIVDVSVRNPNLVTYYFRKSKTSLYYKNTSIGVSIWSDGKASGRKTYRRNVTIDLPEDGLLSMLIKGDALSHDTLLIDGATKVGGHVKILGLIRHHVDVAMNCTVKVGVFNLTIVDQTCRQRVWI